jgi:hypothetical protein
MRPSNLYANGLDTPDRSPVDEAQVQVAREFIRNSCLKRKVFNRRHTSYFLKHVAEDWAKAQGKAVTYISNGAFIAAAIDEGYEWKQEPGSHNAAFKLKCTHPRCYER